MNLRVENTEVNNEKEFINRNGMYCSRHFIVLLLFIFNCIKMEESVLLSSIFYQISPRYSSKHSPLWCTLVAKSTPKYRMCQGSY